MRIYLEALGCRLNYAEVTALGRQLTAAGHEVVGSADDADICILNTCSVTNEAARKSRQLVRQMVRNNPQTQVILTGCFATLEAPAASQLPNVTLIVDNGRKDELASIIEERAPAPALASAPIVNSRVPGDSDSRSRGRTRAFVKIQDGCRNRCTYCVVTLARGEERSRPVAEVVDEISSLGQAGYPEVVLTGVHVGSYGRDRGEGLSALLHSILHRTSLPRIRLSSVEPFDLTPDFFALWRDSGGRLLPHLHLPAQSGSDSVLKRMARRNRTGEYLDLVAAARECIAGLTVTTDLIVGFPGETVAEFEETIALAERCRFAHIHVFPFSARAGTSAARMRGQVPHLERQARSRVLNTLSSRLGEEVRQSFVGGIRPVLWENPVDSSLQVDGDAGAASIRSWSGLTDNYLRVVASAPFCEDLHGRITDVRLIRAAGETLEGEIVATNAPVDSRGACHRDEAVQSRPVYELMGF